MAALEPMNTRRELPESPYLAAATGRKPSRVPVWFMRQAGRSLPEYRALRAKNTMMQACFDAELITEITLQPIRTARRRRRDPVLRHRGAAAGVGHRAGHRARRRAGDRAPDAHASPTSQAMKALEPQQVAPVAQAVTQLVSELGDVPLIGFAGAPFTLASYLVEGGPSRHHERTKAMMLGEPETWHALMTTLTDVTIAFLQTQVDGGRRRDPGVRLLGGHAVAGRLPQLRAAAQRPGVRHAGRRRRADDAFRGRHRRAARRDVGGRRDRSSAWTGAPR